MEDALDCDRGYDVPESPGWVDDLKQARDAKYPEKRVGREGWATKKSYRLALWKPEPPLMDPEPQEVESPERKFARLRDVWKANRGHHSDTVNLVIHPAYQQIIGMGPVAIPFLLRELANRPDRWYWALRAITGEDPVPKEARGNSKAMTQAWLKWGEERGYR